MRICDNRRPAGIDAERTAAIAVDEIARRMVKMEAKMAAAKVPVAVEGATKMAVKGEAKMGVKAVLVPLMKNEAVNVLAESPVRAAAEPETVNKTVIMRVEMTAAVVAKRTARQIFASLLMMTTGSSYSGKDLVSTRYRRK